MFTGQEGLAEGDSSSLGRPVGRQGLVQVQRLGGVLAHDAGQEVPDRVGGLDGEVRAEQERHAGARKGARAVAPGHPGAEPLGRPCLVREEVAGLDSGHHARRGHAPDLLVGGHLGMLNAGPGRRAAGFEGMEGLRKRPVADGMDRGHEAPCENGLDGVGEGARVAQKDAPETRGIAVVLVQCGPAAAEGAVRVELAPSHPELRSFVETLRGDRLAGHVQEALHGRREPALSVEPLEDGEGRRVEAHVGGAAEPPAPQVVEPRQNVALQIPLARWRDERRNHVHGPVHQDSREAALSANEESSRRVRRRVVEPRQGQGRRVHPGGVAVDAPQKRRLVGAERVQMAPVGILSSPEVLIPPEPQEPRGGGARGDACPDAPQGLLQRGTPAEVHLLQQGAVHGDVSVVIPERREDEHAGRGPERFGPCQEGVQDRVRLEGS